MLDVVEKAEMPDWLWDYEHFDIYKVLKDSLYYPACCFDGYPVKTLMGNAYSFVYVDHMMEETLLLEYITERSFKGYKVVFTRNIEMEELIPNGWDVVILPETKLDEERKSHGFSNELFYNSCEKDYTYVKPYCRWFIFERLPDFGEGHNPKRFSLLYIGGDGAATYQAIYLSNRIIPKFLCLINPGWGTDYHCDRSLLARSVRYFYEQNNDPDALPKYLVGHKRFDYIEWKIYPKCTVIEKSMVRLYPNIEYQSPKSDIRRESNGMDIEIQIPTFYKYQKIKYGNINDNG